MKGNHNSYLKSTASAALAVAALIVIGLACGGSSTPPPAAYVGAWTGADGTLITIRSNGTADYKSGSSSVDNGGIAIDEGAKTLKISFAGLGPTYTIDKPPSGDQMTLSGVLFKKGGGSTTGTTSSSSTSGSDSNSPGAKAEVPGNDKLQTLVKTTFLDFGDAVQSGDFSDFHKKVAKVWRDSSSPEEMEDAFKAFIEKKENYQFKKAISALDATFTPAPTIDKVEGLDALVVKGFYPTKPDQTNFELKYTMDEGTWKLIGINIKTTR